MCNAWIMLWRKKYVINVLIESKTRCHQCILEANRSFGEKCLNVMWQWGNWKQKLVSPMYFCVCVVSSGRAPRVGEGGSPPGLDEHRRFFMIRSSSGWVLMLLNFFWSKSMVWALKRTFNHVHSTIQTTCTISYMPRRPYVEFWYISNFLQTGSRQ